MLDEKKSANFDRQFFVVYGDLALKIVIWSEMVVTLLNWIRIVKNHKYVKRLWITVLLVINFVESNIKFLFL